MRSFKWALIFGLIVWAIPFVVAMLVFPLSTSDRPFFESIMPVAVVVAAVIFGVLYFRKVEAHFVREGLLIELNPKYVEIIRKRVPVLRDVDIIQSRKLT